MKKLIFLILLLISTQGLSQEYWVTVNTDLRFNGGAITIAENGLLFETGCMFNDYNFKNNIAIGLYNDLFYSKIGVDFDSSTGMNSPTLGFGAFIKRNAPLGVNFNLNSIKLELSYRINGRK